MTTYTLILKAETAWPKNYIEYIVLHRVKLENFTVPTMRRVTMHHLIKTFKALEKHFK